MIDNKLNYNTAIESGEIKVPIFFQPWWLDLISNFENASWDVAISYNKEGRIEGVLPYYIKNHFGITTNTNPLLTPYLGIRLFSTDLPNEYSKNSFHIKTVRKLIQKLPTTHFTTINLTTDFPDGISFLKEGFDLKSFFSYNIFPDKEHQEIFKNFKPSLKADIKKGARQYQFAKYNPELSSIYLYQLIKETEKTKGYKTKLTQKFLFNLYSELLRRKAGEIEFCINDKNEIVAGALFVKDFNHYYYLLGGRSRKRESRGAVSLLLWDRIKMAIEEGKIFDFEGSYYPGIEDFFRGFGGRSESYYQINKSAMKFLEILKTINKKAP